MSFPEKLGCLKGVKIHLATFRPTQSCLLCGPVPHKYYMHCKQLALPAAFGPLRGTMLVFLMDKILYDRSTRCKTAIYGTFTISTGAGIFPSMAMTQYHFSSTGSCWNLHAALGVALGELGFPRGKYPAW